MLVIKDLLNKAKDIDSREAILLLAFVLKKSQAFVIANQKETVSAIKAERFLKLVKRRIENEPIAYITGSQPFFGLDFKVNRRTLIPRPETETLVEKIISDMSREEGRKKNLALVDIGTGSGCIACSIAKSLPNATVIASDNSPTTLSVVKYNDINLSTGVKVIHSDLFDKKLSYEVAKIISRQKSVALFVVANLPYLPHSDISTVQKDVVDYEPKNALFADDDGMALIKKCIQQLQEFLLPYSQERVKWNLYFEIDPSQVNALKEFAQCQFKKIKIEIKKDLCGRDRFLIIS
jgi:release factor glutamine methyltransferase